MSSLHTCATVHYKRVKFNFLITLTMGTLINQSQMGDLENGLKDLKRSRLMNVQEFKDMYNAIDRHHRDLKLKTAQQRESLKQVYTWFKLNRHTLHSGPHFGKVHHKKEAEDILKLCTTPRTNNQPPKTTTKKSKNVWTDGNKPKDDQNKNMSTTVRLTSAGSSAKRFFQSESPASKMTGGDSFTPRDPFATELPSSKDYVSDYLFSNFLPQSAGKMEFTADDFVSPYADGPEPETYSTNLHFNTNFFHPKIFLSKNDIFNKYLWNLTINTSKLILQNKQVISIFNGIFLFFFCFFFLSFEQNNSLTIEIEILILHQGLGIQGIINACEVSMLNCTIF
ncbi:hypothetical protein KUTeg_025002 [Tegillarca granosa]|uniref:Uncharacterized protein n=1 Tax=Tegillarca granosa TaxID=220873 RepID=A0ABQ9E234_TEGGR|nr:hypothetical protein KUTeg_025002 [Tegillarca granosa]